MAPKSQVGYLVTEVELRKIIFEVNAQCAPGYQGTATTTKCSGHNGPYTLSGCTPAPVCVSPKDLTGYSVTETSLDRSSFKVQATCTDTHTGAAKVAQCTKNLGTYSLSGCAKKIQCASPSFEGYAVTEQNTVAQTFDVAATCARGYEGTAVATACSKTGEKYTLSGCKYSTTTCAAPKATDGYLVTEAQLRKILFDVSVQCAPGYQGTAKVSPCTSQGGAYTLSGCSAAPVCVSPKGLTGYSVTETSLDAHSKLRPHAQRLTLANQRSQNVPATWVPIASLVAFPRSSAPLLRTATMFSQRRIQWHSRLMLPQHVLVVMKEPRL